MNKPLIVASGGLNPSSAIAARMNPGKTMFINLARNTKEYDEEHQEYVEVLNIKEIFEEVDNTIRQELSDANILDMACLGMLSKQESEHPGDQSRHVHVNHREYAEWAEYRSKGEVPTCIFAAAYGWVFERRWYYYAAKGPGIPPEFAIPFDKEWGTQVRVNGDCACRGAEFWGEGFAIDNYHIDTKEGLTAFVKLLDKIHKPRTE